MTKYILSKGSNRKLAKHIGVLNQPHAITCPGKTAICQDVCYAGKASRMYPSARAHRDWVFKLSKQKDFGQDLGKEITKRRLTHVRLHESGDAYSQAYLDKLFEACRMNPGTKFLMYTKSFHLDWTAKPANLVVYWSVDSSTNMASVPAQGPRAYLVLKGKTLPGVTQTCVHSSDKHYCGSECHTCWLGSSDVFFPQH